MTGNGVFQLALYVVVLLLLAKPLGAYMARVYQGQPIGLDRVLGWLERLIYRVAGIRPDAEQGWKAYTIAMLLFNFAGILVVYVLQRLQGVLPSEPAGPRGRVARLVLQHRRQLRHQHQLAGLRRRDDDELPHPDAGAHGAELRLAPRPAWPRWRPSSAGSRGAPPRPSATSGSISRGRRCTSCCRSRSCWRSSWSPRASSRPSAPTRRSRSSSPPSTTSETDDREAGLDERAAED